MMSSDEYHLDPGLQSQLEAILQTPHLEEGEESQETEGETGGESHQTAINFITPDEMLLPQYANILTVNKIGREFTVGFYFLSAPPIGFHAEEGIEVEVPAVCVGRYVISEDNLDQMIGLLLQARGGVS